MSNIYQLIEKDHDRHRELLENIGNSEGDFERRKKWWDEFYYDVKAHAAAEEETFYAKLMEDPGGQDDARHSVSEHKELDDIMEELNGMDLTSSGWLNRFATLKHQYEHHMDEEEDEIFAKGREIFDDSAATKFGSSFVTRKAAEMGLVDEKADASLEE